MEDKLLLKVCLFLSLLGLLLLFFISYNDKELEFDVLLEEDDVVFLKGEVISLNNVSTFTLLKIANEVDIMVFDEIELNEGTDIFVVGKIREYKGSKQILATKITSYN